MISKISHKEFMSATYLKPASLHVELQNGNGLKHQSVRRADERSLTKVIESARLLQLSKISTRAPLGVRGHHLRVK